VSVFIIATLSLGFYIFCINNKSKQATKINLVTLDPDLYDQSWLTGIPCAAPCWYGARPGETSRENVKMIVSRLAFIDSGNIKESSTGGISYPYKNQDGQGDSIGMVFADDTLEEIYMTLNYPITMEQAVEKLGNPDGFSAYPTDPGGTGYYLAVIWKKKQLVLEYTEDSGNISFWSTNPSLYEEIHSNNGKIPKSIIVQDVRYTTPYHIDHMMNYKKWKGFVGN
jgi:hypothetical protein